MRSNDEGDMSSKKSFCVVAIDIDWTVGGVLVPPTVKGSER